MLWKEIPVSVFFTLKTVLPHSTKPGQPSVSVSCQSTVSFSHTIRPTAILATSFKGKQLVRMRDQVLFNLRLTNIWTEFCLSWYKNLIQADYIRFMGWVAAFILELTFWKVKLPYLPAQLPKFSLCSQMLVGLWLTTRSTTACVSFYLSILHSTPLFITKRSQNYR